MSNYGIKTYADLAETCGGMVLANEMAKRPLELVSGDIGFAVSVLTVKMSRAASLLSMLVIFLPEGLPNKGNDTADHATDWPGSPEPHCGGSLGREI